MPQRDGRIELIGARELENALAQLPRATARSVLRRALQKAAKPVAEQAKLLVPKDTGRLQESIGVSTKRSGRHRGPAGLPAVYIGPTRPRGAHGHLLEFGTVKMAARPFMRPAWDTTKSRVLQDIRNELWNNIARAARLLARKAEAGRLTRTAERHLLR